jgi:hypothetical protein
MPHRKPRNRGILVPVWGGKVQNGVRSGPERTVMAVSLCGALGLEVSAPPRSSG